MSSLRIGFCALQVGHQLAWIATKIGLPAFCAAAKFSRVNGLVSVANAGVTKTELAATAARSAARRDSMSEFSPGLCHLVLPHTAATGRHNSPRLHQISVIAAKCRQLRIDQRGLRKLLSLLLRSSAK